MPRAKRGFKAKRRHNRILKQTKGYRGKRRNCHSIAVETLHHAYMHMYRSRKQKKRDFRSLWIARINAAVRPLGGSYSKLIGNLHASGIELNRKMLSELAISDPASFKAVFETAGARA